MEKQKNKIPLVRFPEFKEEWEVKKLGELVDRVITKNKENNSNVLTISAQFGLISQLDYFNKSVSAKNVTGYYLLEKNDFAYNKSYSKGYPMGAIKRLTKYDNGVVSTLYICFRNKNELDNSFTEQYYETGNQNKEIQKIAQEGARNHGLLNIGLNDFFSIPFPFPTLPEQQKIANFFTTLDKKINQLQEKKTLLDAYKKGMMQRLFSQDLRFKDENGKDYTKINTVELGEIVKIKSGNSPTKYNLKDSGTTPFIKVEELNSCNKNIKHSRYYTDNVSDTIPVNSIIFPKRGGAILTNKVRINSVPLFMDSNLMALICDTNQVDFQFLFYKIVFQKLYKIADTSTIPQINNKHIQPLILELPSLSEQTKIANFLSKIDEKTENVNRQIERTKEYKKGMLQRMFV